MLKAWKALPNEAKWAAVVGPLIVGVLLQFAIPAIKGAFSPRPELVALPVSITELGYQGDAGGVAIDIRLINRQAHVAVITGVRLELMRAGVLNECPRYAPLASALNDSGGPYRVLLPPAASVKQNENVMVAAIREIKPDEADRFRIVVGEHYAEDDHTPRVTLWNLRLRLVRADGESPVLLGSVAFAIPSKGLASPVSERLFGGGRGFLELDHIPSYSRLVPIDMMCFVANRTVGQAFSNVTSESRLYRRLRLAANAPLSKTAGFREAYERTTKLRSAADSECSALKRGGASARGLNMHAIEILEACVAVTSQGEVFPSGS